MTSVVRLSPFTALLKCPLWALREARRIQDLVRTIFNLTIENGRLAGLISRLYHLFIFPIDFGRSLPVMCDPLFRIKSREIPENHISDFVHVKMCTCHFYATSCRTWYLGSEMIWGHDVRRILSICARPSIELHGQNRFRRRFDHLAINMYINRSIFSNRRISRSMHKNERKSDLICRSRMQKISYRGKIAILSFEKLSDFFWKKIISKMKSTNFIGSSRAHFCRDNFMRTWCTPYIRDFWS